MQTEMKYIYQIYQKKSFRKAAEALYISQPALSMAVKKVEEELGMPVFDRSVRPIRLTTAGEAYIEYIKNTLALEQEMEQRIQDIRDANIGTIRLGGSHYINAHILPELLVGFMHQHPHISVSLVESSSDILSNMLTQKELDLTFSCDPSFIKHFEHHLAFEDHILLAVPKSFAINRYLTSQRLTAVDIKRNHCHLRKDCPCITLDAFRYTDFLLLTQGNNLRSRTDQIFSESNFKPAVKMEFSQLATAYHMARASLGATFISDRLISEFQDDLFYYKLNTFLTTRPFYILLPKQTYTPSAVRAFIDYCLNNQKQ